MDNPLVDLSNGTEQSNSIGTTDTSSTTECEQVKGDKEPPPNSAMNELIGIDFQSSQPQLDGKTAQSSQEETSLVDVSSEPQKITSKSEASINDMATNDLECGVARCDHRTLVERLHLQLDRLLEEKEQLNQTIQRLDSDLKECEQLLATKEERLRELKDSEQIIGKLKALAIKLKRELAELKESENKSKEELRNVTKEADKVQTAHHLLIKNFQNLQNEHDRLQDEYESTKKSLKLFESDLATNVNELANKKSLIETVRSENEALTKKIARLESKFESEQLNAKEWDSKIIVLKNKLGDEKRKNSKLIEVEKHNQELNERLSAKEASEMQLSQKCEQLVAQCVTLDQKEAEIERLRSELQTLNATLERLKADHDSKVAEQDATAQSARKVEQDYDRLVAELSELKSANETLKSRLADLDQKSKKEFKEKDNLLSLAEEELKSKEKEFAAYKLKVSKVLNEKRNAVEQNSYEQQLLQTQCKLEELNVHVHSLEMLLQKEKEKLLESETNAIELRSQIECLQKSAGNVIELNRHIEQLKANQRDNECKLLNEKRSFDLKVNELQDELMHNRQEYESQVAALESQLVELRETNRSLRANNMIAVKSLPGGNESIDSNRLHNHSNDSVGRLNGSHESEPIEADESDHDSGGDKPKRLSVSSLTSNFVNPLHEILNLKESTSSEKNDQVHQLKELFEESEANNSLLSEQNRVLKEEIRRLQRSIDRTEIAENLEYLKNVLIKFVSVENNTTNAAEKKHLVPVLKTILKLSKEEESKLQNFASFLCNLNERTANGNSSNSSANWSSYLWNGFS